MRIYFPETMTNSNPPHVQATIRENVFRMSEYYIIKEIAKPRIRSQIKV